MNRYLEYYGNNLAHTNWYNILRLGKAYLSQDDYRWLIKEFNKSVHTFTRLSHNAWFNSIFMSQGGWKVSDDEYYEQLVQDLSEFRNAPNTSYYLPDRDPSTYKIDPASVDLSKFFKTLEVEKFWKDIDLQAENAFPVQKQCTTDFLWQRNPFVMTACGCDDKKAVNPGVDYLAAYWMASYEKFLSKDM